MQPMKLSEINEKIKITHRDSMTEELQENASNADPFQLFMAWFTEVLLSEVRDPSAMVLATVDDQGCPDTRVVLLKELEPHQFIFFSGYQSKKGQQLARHPAAAVNFYWPNFTRQVRMRGHVEKISIEQSEKYFLTRPREAQLGTQAWIQSSVIKNREELDAKLTAVTDKFSGQAVPCPDNWGGYAFIPFEYEFFQGRNWRMHDRLIYVLKEGQWNRSRLAP